MRLHLPRYTLLTVTLVVSILAILWMLTLAGQPVHIPVQNFSKGHIPHYTQALSGVKGQTITVPVDSLSRIDVWIRTRVNASQPIEVRFELTRGVDEVEPIASAVVEFNSSSPAWQTRITFDPRLVSQGDTIYLRMKSILGSPSASISYAYVRGNLYPEGELFDLNRVEVPDQDLRFKLYRHPIMPKPLAWLEATIAPALSASEQALGPPAWIVGVLAALVITSVTAFVIITSGLIARLCPNEYRRRASLALLLAQSATVLAILAGSEAPLGKLWVHLS